MNRPQAERHLVDADTVGQGVTYGPAVGVGGYVLTTITDDGRVEIVFPEIAMYTLWSEVRGTPWPDSFEDDEHDRRVRQLVQLGNDSSEERLEEAIAVLRGER